MTSQGVQATAVVAGLMWGALHAVSGPDHVLCLAPRVIAQPRGAWLVGLLWGAGHGLGTVVFFGAMAALVRVTEAERLVALADRAAGLSLVATGLLGLRGIRVLRARELARAAAVPWRYGAFLVGLLHGFTGAAAVLVAVPALGGGGAQRSVWLLGFAVGSAAAMALLTTVLAAGSRAIAGRVVGAAAAATSALSVFIGLAFVAR
jgi:nickel/cobalt exporter